MGQRKRILKDQQGKWTLSEVDCDWSGLWWAEVIYLLKQEGQELDDLVGRQRLHIRLFEAAQVLIFGLKWSRKMQVRLWTLKVTVKTDPCEVHILPWPTFEPEWCRHQPEWCRTWNKETVSAQSGSHEDRWTRWRSDKIHSLRFDWRHPRSEHPRIPVHLVQDVHLRDRLRVTPHSLKYLNDFDPPERPSRCFLPCPWSRWTGSSSIHL